MGEYAWYDGNSGDRTHPVGEKRSNEWGFHDMHGNVWEWCLDWKGNYPGGRVTDYIGVATGYRRVYRGGSWWSGVQSCRSADRYGHSSDNRYNSLGFRLALGPEVVAVRSGTEAAMASTQATVTTSPERRPISSRPQPQPGQTYIVPDLGVKLLWVQPGTFTMGSPDGESGRDSDEGPQTKVTMNRGFWLGQYEVTQGEWRAVMGNNPSNFKGNDRLPVESVSWEDATNYCAKMTERERTAGHLLAGFVFRLPTEAEWEHACRAGSTSRYAFGDSEGGLGEYAWYDRNSGGKTHPVGEKKANAWGFHDMHGNVWEWCQDWYEYRLQGGSVTDYSGPGSGSDRVLRGGAWGATRGIAAWRIAAGMRPAPAVTASASALP